MPTTFILSEQVGYAFGQVIGVLWGFFIGVDMHLHEGTDDLCHIAFIIPALRGL